MFVIGFSDQPMKMATNVDDFSTPLWPKYKVWRNFKGGCPPAGCDWMQPHSIHTVWWVADTFLLFENPIL